MILMAIQINFNETQHGWWFVHGLGCIYLGTTELATISTKQDSTEYQNHLKDNFLPAWNGLSGLHEKFMHDNARYHISSKTKEGLQQQNITILD